MSDQTDNAFGPLHFVNPADIPLETRIAENAYFRAQQRGFEPGYEVEDWLAAESELKLAASSNRKATKVLEDFPPAELNTRPAGRKA